MDVVILNSSPGYDESQVKLGHRRSSGVFRTLGAYKISHEIRKMGYASQVIDYATFMTHEQLYKALRKFVGSGTSIIGISTTFMVGSDLKLPSHVINALNDIIDDYPNVKLVFGGWYANALKTDKRLIHRNYYAVGEYGEDIIRELLLHIKTGSPLPHNKDSIDNFFIKSREEHYDIQTDNHIFTERDCILPGEVLPIEMSRGCIFKCKFCNHLLLGRGKLDYLRDFELVKNEMIHNYEKFKVANYHIICDTFNDTEYKMQEWHKMVSSLPFKITFTSYLRSDLLDRYREVPVMLKETGLTAAFLGIDSLGVEQSKIIGKGWSGSKAREFIPHLYHDLWKGDVHQTVSFIAGLPGDTREHLRDTVKWFEDSDLYHMIMHPLSIGSKHLIRNASEFEMNAEKYGYKFQDPTSAANWSNDYWNYKECMDFVMNEIRPKLHENTSYLMGAWQIGLLQYYGFTKEQMRKKNFKNHINGNIVAHRDRLHIDAYIAKLMSL